MSKILIPLFAALLSTAAAQTPSPSPNPITHLLFPPGSKVPDVYADPSAPEGVFVDRAHPEPPVVAKTIGAFFDSLQKGDVDAAYDLLAKGSSIGEKAEDVSNLKAKTHEAISVFGEIQGSELIAIKQVGAHLLSATYLSLGKDLPLRWKFYFYRLEGSWKLIDIGVDDRLIDIFDNRDPAAATAVSATAAQP